MPSPQASSLAQYAKNWLAQANRTDALALAVMDAMASAIDKAFAQWLTTTQVTVSA
jgi:hypothetical protein